MPDDNVNVTEFNSNVAVLIRVNKIINAINDARFLVTQKDNYGNPRAEIEEMLTHIVNLYKEVQVELKDSEADIWEEDIKPLRNRIRNNPPDFFLNVSYWRKTLFDLDDLDIKIRMLAKRHGFLSSNKRDVRVAALRR